MTWEEVLELAQYGVAETITSATGFFHKEQMKLQGSLSQRRISAKMSCLSYDVDAGTSISLVKDQVLYSLPADCNTVLKVKYESESWLTQLEGVMPNVTPYESATPEAYWLQGQSKIGLYPASSATTASNKKIYIFGTRQTPICAMRITYKGTATSCYFSFDGTNFKITEGTTVLSTYAASTYSTMTLLVEKINTDTATNKCAAVIDATCQASALTANIEQTTETIYQQNLQSFSPAQYTKRIYFNPELDDLLLNDIVVAEIILHQRDKDLDSYAKQAKQKVIDQLIIDRKVEFDGLQTAARNRVPKRSNTPYTREGTGSLPGYFPTVGS
jgi:hypothetical protein